MSYFNINFIKKSNWGPPWSYGSWIYNYLCNQCLSPLILWVRISIRARCTLAKGRWFSPGPPVSSTNKTDHHNRTEILLTVTHKTVIVSYSELSVYLVCLFVWYCLTPLSTIFQFYHGGQFVTEKVRLKRNGSVYVMRSFVEE